jgi:hypothetical protein
MLTMVANDKGIGGLGQGNRHCLQPAHRPALLPGSPGIPASSGMSGNRRDNHPWSSVTTAPAIPPKACGKTLI